ncbi:MAG: transcription antitermination factor NusB [Chlamydiia bacterium]|nr:transcription antitermination factor NusB [Chlamydiia bacterium]
MTLPNEKFREVLFVLLYSRELSTESDEELVSLVSKELKVASTHVRTALERVRKILDRKEEIDEKLRTLSTEYTFERIQVVEKCILRLDAYEILFDDSIPAKVSIAEGLRLSKKFSTSSSVSFVNALLDALWKNEAGEPIEKEALKQSIEEMTEVEQLTEQYIREQQEDSE